MNYIIYNQISEAETRHLQITTAAREANFLNNQDNYEAIVYHPDNGKAALPILKSESVYYQGFPTQAFNFEIFFTAQELAKAVIGLSADWFPVYEDF